MRMSVKYVVAGLLLMCLVAAVVQTTESGNFGGGELSTENRDVFKRSKRVEKHGGQSGALGGVSSEMLGIHDDKFQTISENVHDGAANSLPKLQNPALIHRSSIRTISDFKTHHNVDQTKEDLKEDKKPQVDSRHIHHNLKHDKSVSYSNHQAGHLNVKRVSKLHPLNSDKTYLNSENHGDQIKHLNQHKTNHQVGNENQTNESKERTKNVNKKTNVLKSQDKNNIQTRLAQSKKQSKEKPSHHHINKHPDNEEVHHHQPSIRSGPKDVFTNSFLVRLHRSVDSPKRLATKHGFHYMGKVLGDPLAHHFKHGGLSHARTRRSVPHTRLLRADPWISTAIQQVGFKRVKRGYQPMGDKRGYHPLRVENLVPPESLRDSNKVPTDPDFKHQWYLRNTGQNGGKPRLDLNVAAAWALGYTGKNVTTAIMDDGVDYIHADLKRNYNARASWDFSSNDPFPYPRYTDDWFNSHGTRCAGEISAQRDNGVCGVGVAYDSKVAGIRMLDQPYMTDLIEANSMGHEPHLIDIYSASWGPTDDGKTVDGPRNATMRAIVRGVNEGRNGKGNIYVWASGDGGADDDCNCDGYAASMWTISINSAINDGSNAHYDESCSSTLASTFSNGAKDPTTGVATTDLYNQCTLTHSGTSAAAPEAAGVFALAIEANPELTWRDIQHLTVLTSKRNSLFDAKRRFAWRMNGVGLEYNHLFGFGVLDAGAMVALARHWQTVPARYHCQGGTVVVNKRLTHKLAAIASLTTSGCAGNDTQVNYLEHVQAVISLNASRRGDVELFLTSPMGTKSMILSRRPNDNDSTDGFTKWPFMTSHTWAENPRGVWTLEARLNSASQSASALLRDWTLMLHGTQSAPYTHLPAPDPHSKLAIVKKAHETRKRN